MRLLISIITLLAIVLFSCNNNNNRDYKLQIDSLNLQLENAIDNYSLIDSATIAGIRENVNRNCDNIEYTDDTNFSKIFIPYSQISKSLKQVLKMNIYLRNEIQNSRLQINNLLHDANNNLVDTTLLIQYIEDEKKAVNILIDRINFFHLRVISETNRYDSLNPLIEKLIK